MKLNAFAMAYVLISFYSHLKYGDLPERDERTIRASGHVAGATLLALFLSITIMDKFKLLTLTVSQILAALFFILIFVLMFLKKGDVE